MEEVEGAVLVVEEGGEEGGDCEMDSSSPINLLFNKLSTYLPQPLSSTGKSNRISREE